MRVPLKLAIRFTQDSFAPPHVGISSIHKDAVLDRIPYYNTLTILTSTGLAPLVKLDFEELPIIQIPSEQTNYLSSLKWLDCY